MLAEFDSVARTISYQTSRIPIVSNLTGKIAGNEIATPSYWVRHISQPVQFRASMQTLQQQGYGIFVEIGAKPILLAMGQQCISDGDQLWLASLAKNGHNPETGIVSIALHTFVGSDFNQVREQIRVPYCEYFKSNIGLLNGLAQSRNHNIDISSLSAKELDDFVNFIFEKFATSRGLIGTPLTCLNLLEQLENIGVNEVSCLLDFGLNKNVILSHLPDLNQLREVYNHQVNNKINSIKTTDSVSLNSPSKKLITKQFSHRV